MGLSFMTCILPQEESKRLLQRIPFHGGTHSHYALEYLLHFLDGLQWFDLKYLTPKRCLQSDYTAFGFNCQLRSCRILVGFLVILPIKPTITSKTKKAPEPSTYPKGRKGSGAFSIMPKRR